MANRAAAGISYQADDPAYTGGQGDSGDLCHTSACSTLVDKSARFGSRSPTAPTFSDHSAVSPDRGRGQPEDLTDMSSHGLLKSASSKSVWSNKFRSAPSVAQLRSGYDRERQSLFSAQGLRCLRQNDEAMRFTPLPKTGASNDPALLCIRVCPRDHLPNRPLSQILDTKIAGGAMQDLFFPLS